MFGAQRLAVQHLLPAPILRPNPRFSTFLQLPISFPICLLKSLQIPSAQCRGRQPALLSPVIPLTGVTGTTYNHLPGHPCSQIMYFSILPTLLSLSFPFFAVLFPPPSRKESSQHFLLLHLDSVSFISHKCMRRFLHFFICSLRLQ